jgi:hypothetical protein
VARTAVSRFLIMYILVPLLAVWAYHLVQRRYAEVGERKRLASMLVAVLIIGLWAVSYFFLRFNVDDLYLIPVFLLAVALAVWQRKLFFPYRLSCATCRAPLPLKKILFFDSNACDACDPPKSSEGAQKS